MCRCAERRQMIKQAAKGQVPVAEATSYVVKTLSEDATQKVMRKLNQRFNRRAA